MDIFLPEDPGIPRSACFSFIFLEGTEQSSGKWYLCIAVGVLQSKTFMEKGDSLQSAFPSVPMIDVRISNSMIMVLMRFNLQVVYDCVTDSRQLIQC